MMPVASTADLACPPPDAGCCCAEHDARPQR